LPDEVNRVGYAFIVLVRDEVEARRVRGALEDLLTRNTSATIVMPPLRGVAFFADAHRQDEMDVWWRMSIPAGATPVYLLDEDEGVADWVAGLDGVCYVGDRSAAVESVSTLDRCEIRRVTIRTSLELVARVTRDFAGERGPFDAHQSVLLERLVNELPEPAKVSTSGASDWAVAAHSSVADDDAIRREVPVPVKDPFELLAEMTTVSTLEQDDMVGGPLDVRHVSDAAKPSPATMSMRLPGWARRITRRVDSRPASDSELASLLSGRAPTIVAVGSRKGGVGKTSHAAGVAIVAGAVLDTVGHQVAIVDANIANPDAWGQLSLPAGAATVRDVVAALATNRDPLRPVFASTPALACYPESRTPSEYSRTDISRLADYLRDRYALVIVDMSNRLPDPSAGPEAAVAAFWLEQADVLVLPTASSKQDFNGVLDFLDLRRLPSTVVAYLVPRTRRNRDHPLTKRYMAAIAQRAWRVVSLPDDADGVRYAGMEGIPVQQVSTQMRAAYRALTEAIARAPKRGDS
jgi:MinD-like ATPase involved in chromosome partitioning or flagellar assembly